MIVHTFRGPGRIFGFTAQSDGANLPKAHAPWTAFKTIELHPDEPHAGIDPNACLADIEAHGFHLTDAHVRIAPESMMGGA